jgi:hypothetical protein
MSIISVKDLTNLFVPQFIIKLNEQIEKINSKNLDGISEGYNEFLYNTKMDRQLNEVIDYKLNDYMDSVNILKDRTLYNLYHKTIEYIYENRENICSNEVQLKLLNTLIELNSKNLDTFFYRLVLGNKKVNRILMPFVEKLESHCQSQIDRLDAIPHIEQKTPEWFAVRENMISASICGYLDSDKCQCGKSKETEKVKEKTYLKEKKGFSWSQAPLRHGQQFEDLTGEFYDAFNFLRSKEYGILPDYRLDYIGASPDGIITNVENNNFYYRRKFGRMREIKNPISREIKGNVVNYYYYQTQQQMYVCDLPMCDYMETSFKYPSGDLVTDKHYFNDVLDMDRFNNCQTIKQLYDIINPALLNNLNYIHLNYLLKQKYGRLENVSLNELDYILTKLIIEKWNDLSVVKLSNINQNGDAKGILWCYTQPDGSGGVNFKVEWLGCRVPIISQEQIEKFEADNNAKYEAMGYTLEEKHYWSMEKYNVVEIEYSKELYENDILPRLTKKWNIIKELRSIENKDERQSKYEEYYPKKEESYEKSFKKMNKTRTYKKKAKPVRSAEFDLFDLS